MKSDAPSYSRSDDLPYTGPQVPVPDLGADSLDEHGAPRAAQPRTSDDGESCLSAWDLRQLVASHHDRVHALMQQSLTTDLDLTFLDVELRQRLADLGVPPERIEVELATVMSEIFKPLSH